MSPVDVVSFPRERKAAPNPDWGFSLAESMGNRFTGLLLIPTLGVGLLVGAAAGLALARWLPPSRFEWPSSLGVLVAGVTFSALHFVVGRRPVGKPLRLTPRQLTYEGREVLNQGLTASPEEGPWLVLRDAAGLTFRLPRQVQPLAPIPATRDWRVDRLNLVVVEGTLRLEATCRATHNHRGEPDDEATDTRLVPWPSEPA